MRAAERATKAGFAAAASLVEPGRTEREVQIELEAEFFRSGARQPRVRHDRGGRAKLRRASFFPPTQRGFEDGELVLIDAGGEVRGYASDVTRTYPASGTFDSAQEDIHTLVRVAGETAKKRCRAGVEFADVHLAAALVLAEGLRAFGLLKGRPEDLVSNGAVSVFFPHGIGHMVGLGIRDAGELVNTRHEDNETLAKLRTTSPCYQVMS
jgi:Xaa-Pro aminopeptidase